MSYSKQIASTLQINEKSVNTVLELLAEGASIPFIARYRKDKTNNLDEVQIEQIQQENKRLTDFFHRQEVILKSIEEQGKLTPDLKAKILATTVLSELEDIYLPYKPKRRTRAQIAREHGLEPLALIISLQRILVKKLLSEARLESVLRNLACLNLKSSKARKKKAISIETILTLMKSLVAFLLIVLWRLFVG